MRRISMWLSALFLLSSFFSVAQNSDCKPVKNDAQLVYDIAGLFDATQQAQLENELQSFAKSTSNQIVLIVANDLCGQDISQYATEVGQDWGVGQAKQDNGLVIVLKPKTATEKGEVNISTGRGLEGVLPDGKCWLIEQEEMLPYFKQNDYFGGIQSALVVIKSLAQGEYNIAQYEEKHGKGRIPWFSMLFGLIIFIVVIVRLFRNANRYAGANGIDLFTAMMLMSNSGRSHGGSWSNFSGGGGGFGGFGGGGFGGGGASSSW